MADFGFPRAITANDYAADFDCGEASLDQWITLKAVKNERAGASRTFITVEATSGLIAGYYCISAGSLAHEESPGKLRRNMPSPIPIILIGRLAVDVRFQGMNVGASLLQDAVAKSIEASRIIGARAIVVHALSASAERFYSRFGFVHMPGSSRAMYLLIQDAELTIAEL